MFSHSVDWILSSQRASIEHKGHTLHDRSNIPDDQSSRIFKEYQLSHIKMLKEQKQIEVHGGAKNRKKSQNQSKKLHQSKSEEEVLKHQHCSRVRSQPVGVSVHMNQMKVLVLLSQNFWTLGDSLSRVVNLVVG